MFVQSVSNEQKQQQPKAKKPVEVLNWPSIDLDVGQITGVAVDENANPVILHRGNVKWTGRYNKKKQNRKNASAMGVRHVKQP